MPEAMRRVVVFCLAAVAIWFVQASFSGASAAAPIASGPEAREQSAAAGPHLGAHPSEAQQGVFARNGADRSGDPSSRDAPTLIPEYWAKNLPPILRVRIIGLVAWKGLALLVVLVLGLILRKIIQFVLRVRLAPVAARMGAASVGHIVDVFAGPGSTLVVAGLLAVVYPQLALSEGAERILSVFVRALAILSVVLSLYRVVDVLADAMVKKAEQTESKLDDQLVPLVRKALKVLVVLSGCLFLLQNLEVNVGSLVAGLGIGGVAVALAAKDTIANFFGSVMIFIDRPFQIGDWVRINEVEGIVEEVGFRSTRVRTFYNSLVTVPNAHFTEASIDNMGLRQYRRLVTTLNLTYDTTPAQMQAFVEGIRAIVVANPTTRKDYYEVHFSGFGPHSLDVMVYLFFKVSSWTEELEQKHNVLMEILRLAKELGVSFAFPTQTLHVEALTQQGQVGIVPEAPKDTRLKEVVASFGPGGERSRPHAPTLTEGYFARLSKWAGDGDN